MCIKLEEERAIDRSKTSETVVLRIVSCLGLVTQPRLSAKWGTIHDITTWNIVRSTSHTSYFEIVSEEVAGS